ncbi:hypothetical protein GALMADRAFT_147139 [Galerina marginata CBS 339.88]|uniref:Mid2 domain-containing protein n=1 Tax=Galerina marginata (strain CBS 339.88) TaxID=685588 RepID=A0A067SBK6_GALM3|nr:hypothetical protein GALMADRAFT_147139 [Galerina marginata CBS 339.88]
MLAIFYVLLLAGYFSFTVALVNVTIDDLDPSILYQPPEKWKTISDAACSGGGYNIGHDSCVNATIQCTWVSFYYLSPRWPYPISTEISIDGEAPIVVDLQDHSLPITDSGPSTGGSIGAFSYHGTESKLHTIVVTGSAQNPYAVVDSLVFETEDGGPCQGKYGYGGSNNSYPYGSTKTNTITTTTTTTTTQLSTVVIKTGSYPSGSGTAPPSTYSSSPPVRIVVYSNHGLIIGIGILGAIIALLVLLLLMFLMWRRRRHANGQYGHSVPPRPGSSHESLNPTYGGGDTRTGTYAGGADTTHGGGVSTYGGAGSAAGGESEQPYMRETN